jgi:hypothetical protein
MRVGEVGEGEQGVARGVGETYQLQEQRPGDGQQLVVQVTPIEAGHPQFPERPASDPHGGVSAAAWSSPVFIHGYSSSKHQAVRKTQYSRPGGA